MTAGAENASDVVILEAGGEHVGCAVASGIDDQHDRTLVSLSDRIAKVGRSQRKSLRERGANFDRLFGRGLPRRKLPVLLAHLQREVRVDQMEALWLDSHRGHLLQDALTCGDGAASLPSA